MISLLIFMYNLFINYNTVIVKYFRNKNTLIVKVHS
jgi:hypothetical protein